MKLNYNTRISGKLVVLVPYRKEHVPKYHEWMKSEELQHLTASEPLSIEDEYNMQKAWFEDENKCTFIVLDKCVFEDTGSEIDAMVGDTNLFLQSLSDGNIVAEAEIMIAPSEFRGKGLGREAVLLMLRYGCEDLNVSRFQVKIGINNKISLSMFEKIGFQRVGLSEVFEEVTLEKNVSDEWICWLKNETCTSMKTVNQNVFEK